MIISRAPFRISFFGGGTDYPVWFREHEGAVLATTINKYCYISVRYLPPFFDYKSRIVWSKIESVKNFDEIEHSAVRATLKYLNVTKGVSLHHDADLPARSGVGSSSTFTVGLLQALHGLQGRMVTKQKLAAEAIHIEQYLLKENVGCQDQVIAVHGGLNRINFCGDDNTNVTPIILSQERLELLQSHLMLFFTGLSRTASEIAKKQIETTKNKKRELQIMYGMVGESIKILQNSNDLIPFGQLLHESWKIKRELTDKITNPHIDELYETARKAGAIGGKLLGAGGGGFMLVFAKPEYQKNIRENLSHLLHVPFSFENMGSQIVYYQPTND
ncbi:MAG: kinase [Deltaproteobacteria bacterium]|nr:kinase [Deltaproteobacteria bacterium]